MNGVVLYIHNDLNIDSILSAWQKHKSAKVFKFVDPIKFKDIRQVATTEFADDDVAILSVQSSSAEKVAEILKFFDEYQPKAVIARLYSKTGDDADLESLFSTASGELSDESPWVNEEYASKGKVSLMAATVPAKPEEHVKILAEALSSEADLDKIDDSCDETVVDMNEKAQPKESKEAKVEKPAPVKKEETKDVPWDESDGEESVEEPAPKKPAKPVKEETATFASKLAEEAKKKMGVEAGQVELSQKKAQVDDDLPPQCVIDLAKALYAVIKHISK